MLDQAFDALKSYDWGVDCGVLHPIDEAIVSTHGNDAARKELENRLTAALGSSTSRAAKEYVCRKLMVIGSAASVPTLSKLLSDKDHSHMARYALERIPAPEAAKALRDALGAVGPAQKIGIISSLGARRDADSVTMLASLVGDSDQSVARAAAAALGAIRTGAAAKAVSSVKPGAGETAIAVIDATLANAESLLAAGAKAEALAIYKSIASQEHPKHVKLAATRGVLACAGKKEA